MGWLWFEKPANVKARLDAVCTWDREGESRGRVLKSALVSMSEYYAAVEVIKANGERFVFAAVFLVKFATNDGIKEMGYKDQDESMGPYVTRCPVAILDLLTDGPEVNDYARQWRERCRAYHTKRKDRTPEDWMIAYRKEVLGA